jgi:MFS superfamily sulfate permease-like transporter
MDRNFYEIRESNNDSVMKQITGQYVQKELILDIASWISPEFYDKCNNIIINYFTNQYLNMSNDEKHEQIQNLEERMKRLLIDNENKDNVIQEKNDKIDKLMIKLDEDRKRMEAQREEDRKRMEAQRESTMRSTNSRNNISYVIII